MESKDKGFIIDIVPIAHLPFAKQQFFSYLAEKELLAGTLVDIPLFKRSVEGIVLGSRSDFERLGNIQLKKINSVVEENFLTKEQLELADFISEYYFCSLGTVLKFFIPKRMKERNKKQETRNKQNTKEIKLTKEQETAVKKITSHELPATSYLLFGPASSGKTEIYINAISKLLAKDNESQFLILLPELTLTPQATERYAHLAKPEEIVMLHSKISKGQLWSAWQKIKSGEAKIIIGTRMAIFAPFQNLKMIVIDEEQDISFKQWDMHPKYDARKVAEKIAQLHQAKIIFGSATPSVETYHRAMSKELALLTLPQLKLPSYEFRIPTYEVVDMKKERWNKNTSIISKKLKGELAYALKNKLQSIMFVNRQGMSAFSICEKCKTVLACPKCDRALVYDENGTYHCLHCNYHTGAFVNCPKCKEMIFKNIGIGTQKVEREILHFFPGARIKRVDFESMKKAGDAEKLYQEFADKNIDIIIGTQMITKGWDLPNVALIGIIDADSLLAMPDFKTDEKAFQNIVQVAGRANRLGSKYPGRILIQTYNPENFVIRSAAKMDYLKFFAKEIEDRKILSYPPFAQILKLTIQDYSKNLVDKDADNLYQKLDGLNENKITASVPQDPMVNKVRGRFKKQIILKIKDDNIPDSLEKILTELGRGWSIDRDPISIS
jgi:primosomal protein N' (replication factor Y)